MAHQVEQMAYVGQKPWHGLGVDLPPDTPPYEFMRQAGLDWSVSKRPLVYRDANGFLTEVPNRFALARDDNGRTLSIVSDSYVPTQNQQLFEFLEEYLRIGEAHLETAGSLKEGENVWALANISKSFVLKGDDEVNAYLLVTNSHTPYTALNIFRTSIRVVCNNTLNFAFRKDGANAFRFVHRAVFDEEAQQRVKEQMGIARANFDAYKTVCEKLVELSATEAMVHTIISNAVNGDPELEIDDQPRAYSKIRDLFEGQGKGADLASSRGTAWGLLNAVTEHVDHHAGRSSDTRMRSAWLGQGAQIKTQTLRALAELAEAA